VRIRVEESVLAELEQVPAADRGSLVDRFIGIVLDERRRGVALIRIREDRAGRGDARARLRASVARSRSGSASIAATSRNETPGTYAMVRTVSPERSSKTSGVVTQSAPLKFSAKMVAWTASQR